MMLMTLLQAMPVLPSVEQLTTAAVLFSFAWIFWKKIGEQDKRIDALHNLLIDMNTKLIEVVQNNTLMLERVEEHFKSTDEKNK